MRLILIALLLLTFAGCATTSHNVVEPTAVPSLACNTVRASLTRNTYFKSAHDSFVWPVRGSIIAAFGSKIGKVRNKGIDIKASEGYRVLASRAGKVVFCDEKFRGFGKTIILDHGDNFETVYAYNSSILVSVGDIVRQNQEIARVGRTGRAREPSLHFEIRKSGQPQNPFSYLTD